MYAASVCVCVCVCVCVLVHVFVQKHACIGAWVDMLVLVLYYYNNVILSLCLGPPFSLLPFQNEICLMA